MDHVKSLIPGSRDLVVPYVVLNNTTQYDRASTSFSEFRRVAGLDQITLQKHGWNNSDKTFTQSSFTQAGRRSWEEVESILQEWLYFGLLSEMFEANYAKEDFIATAPNGERKITTQKLPLLLNRLGENSEISPAYLQRIFPSLLEASEFVNNFLGSHSLNLAACPLQPHIALSIGVLVGTLSAAVQIISGDRLPMVATTQPSLLGKLLADNSICITTVSMLEKTAFGPHGQYYAYLLGSAVGERDHSKCTQEEPHCLANQVDPKSPPTKHTLDCPKVGCPFEPVSEDEINQIELEGKIHPVVRVRPDADGNLKPYIKPSTPNQPYVAISHVWSDGLGCADNALPRCQLRRLQKLCNDLYGRDDNDPIPFWLDTLCLPKTDREKRKKAISMMNVVYDDADRVLVLDSQFSNNPVASCHSEYTEILMRIFMSNWMRRLWTLSESFMGNHVYFVFPDGIVNMEDICERMRSHLQTPHGIDKPPADTKLPILYPGQSISRMALKQFQQLREIRQTTVKDRLAAIWNNMQWRSTSHLADESTCLSMMFEFSPEDIKAILDAPDRWEKFLNLVVAHRVSIPRGILFTAQPRMESEGLHWAPTSFFSNVSAAMPVSGTPAAQGAADGKGVVFIAPGFELYMPPTPIKSRFVMVEEASKTFYDVDYATSVVANRTPWELLGPEKLRDLAIIMQFDPQGHKVGGMGLLVMVKRREKDGLRAISIGRVFVKQFLPSVMSWGAIGNWKGADRADEMQNGLMKRLWNRSSNLPTDEPVEDATQQGIVDATPGDRWRVDPAALNDELSCMFASSTALPREQRWHLE